MKGKLWFLHSIRESTSPRLRRICQVDPTFDNPRRPFMAQVICIASHDWRVLTGSEGNFQLIFYLDFSQWFCCLYCCNLYSITRVYWFPWSWLLFVEYWCESSSCLLQTFKVKEMFILRSVGSRKCANVYWSPKSNKRDVLSSMWTCS